MSIQQLTISDALQLIALGILLILFFTFIKKENEAQEKHFKKWDERNKKCNEENQEHS